MFIKDSAITGRIPTRFTLEGQTYTESLTHASSGSCIELRDPVFFFLRRKVVIVRSMGTSFSSKDMLSNEFLF